MPVTAVLAAGVGVRHGWGWALRSASFRLEAPQSGQPVLGILIPGHDAGAASVARRARLAAAAVHQPELLLIDGLLDGLAPEDAAMLADSIRDIGLDSGIVAAGSDIDCLALTCGDILTLADGILVGA